MDPKIDKIYAGDIYASIDIMNVLNREANRTMQNVTKVELTCYLEVTFFTDFAYLLDN